MVVLVLYLISMIMFIYRIAIFTQHQ